MNVGLINLEPQINNTALMKISRFHKDCGDRVGFYTDLFRKTYDKIYCSSLFDFTNKSQVPEQAICGGTGFDIEKKLPDEIENCDLDYSIYPNCNTSYIWFSRGCIRNCPFCIVRQKEGYIKPVKKINNLNPKGKMIDVLDNNFFANPEWRTAIKFLSNQNTFLNFHGIDARILNEEQTIMLSKLKFGGEKRSTWVKKEKRGKMVKKQMKIAWDDPRDDLVSQLKLMTKYIKPYRILCYVLIGYWSNEAEDLMRVRKLRELKIDPFVMPYDKKDKYQKRFARWVNMKAVFKSVSWEDYKRERPKQSLS